MTKHWPASPPAARVWRRIGVDGDVREGHGLLSMRRQPMTAGPRELTWQHLDRADESGVRSFISITGFAYGDELLDSALLGPSRARVMEHGDATSFAFLAVRRSTGEQRPAGRDLMTTEPIAIVIADDYLLTVGRSAAIDFDAVVRRVRALTAGARGPATVRALRLFVLLALIEQAIESFADCADELVAQLNRIEELVFADPLDGVRGFHAIYQYKRDLMTMKRAVIPLRQPLESIIARQSGGIGEETLRHLSGVQNDIAGIIERVLYCDDAINSILHANLAQVDVAQNSDMRRIAAVGAILAFWGIIAGIYQMTEDFEELHRSHGVALFWSVTAGAAIVSVALCALFRRIRWL
jgi:magnesium transporter